MMMFYRDVGMAMRLERFVDFFGATSVALDASVGVTTVVGQDEAGGGSVHVLLDGLRPSIPPVLHYAPHPPRLARAAAVVLGVQVAQQDQDGGVLCAAK